MSKDIDQLLQELRAQGWRVTRTRNNHYRAYPPGGQGSPVWLPGTPSDHRSLANTIALLRQRGFIWKGR